MTQASVRLARALPRPGGGDRRRVRRVAATLVVAGLTVLGGMATVLPTRAQAATSSFSCTAPTCFNVTAAPYSADASGVKDSTKAIQQAINDAQSAGSGNVVYFPAGTYSLLETVTPVNGKSLMVSGANPVTLQGDGAGASKIVEQKGKDAIDVTTDGTVINGLTIDSQTNPNAQTALIMNADNTLLENSTLLGGANTFTIYYPGPATASRTNLVYATGNQVINVTVNDQWTLDGFSFSYQENALIQNVTHTGSRLALFIDKNVEVDGYSYTPGAQTGGTQGFWITPPSDSITINNFVTNGNGGTLGSNTGGWYSTNIAINNEVFNNPGFHLSVGEVQGLTINGCNFGSDSELRFMESAQATGVLVENCSALPVVRFSSAGTVSANFNNDTYPAFTPALKEGSQTFLNSNGGSTDFTVSGGTFQNCAGGFFKGTNTTFAVSGLTGYPCAPDSPPSAALTVSQSPTTQLGITADASASTDTDSTPIADYQFNWGDGTSTPRQPSASVTHTYATPNTYTVTVTVIDTAGLFSTASQSFTVTQDMPPTAVLSVTPGSGTTPLPVTADASQSTDTDTTPIASYTFDFGDGTVVGPQSGATAQHTYSNAGHYTVTVTVTDTASNSSQATQPVSVSPPNLVGNPGFENDSTSGWKAGAGSSLAISTTVAHSGSYSAQVTRRSSNGRGLITDSPPWNGNTVAGTSCTVSAWVLGPSGVNIFAKTTELQGTTVVATHKASVKSAGSWLQVSLTVPVVNGGDALDIAFYEPLNLGQTLYVDDVSETCQ